ncbi:MAG TPA: peptidylprolyl isomerase [Candidatus Faecousia intestinigallinarum]|nr:peptidylprolyl isomerase [Candidatus Faecousia intestinigallinarum]
MKCKFCQAEIPEDSQVCPVCGSEEPQPDTEPAEVLEDHRISPPCEDSMSQPETGAAEAQESPACEDDECKQEPETANATEEKLDTPVCEDSKTQPKTAEPPEVKPGIKPWKVVTAVLAVVLLLAGLAAGILAGMAGKNQEETNPLADATTEATAATVPADWPSYTVEAEDAPSTAGKVVATLGDAELTNGQLQIYYWMNVYNFLNYYGGYLTSLGLDITQPLDAQVGPDGDGTWQQYFLEGSLQNWQRYQALALMAEESGETLGEDFQELMDSMPKTMEETAAEQGYDSAEAMLQQEMGPGVSMEDYRYYLSRYYLGYQYFEKEYEKMTASDAEIEEYYTEHAEEFAANGMDRDEEKLIDVRHILVQPESTETDEEGKAIYTEEAWEECRARAQRILEEWLAGEASEDSFAQLAMAYSVDGSAVNGGLYTGVYQGQMVEPFEDWCFDESRQTGDYGIVETQYGCHVMYFSGLSWYNQAKNSLLSEKSNAFMEDVVARYPMEVDYDEIALAEAPLMTAALRAE